jgi:hypothetical protein
MIQVHHTYFLPQPFPQGTVVLLLESDIGNQVLEQSTILVCHSFWVLSVERAEKYMYIFTNLCIYKYFYMHPPVPNYAKVNSNSDLKFYFQYACIFVSELLSHTPVGN